MKDGRYAHRDIETKTCPGCNGAGETCRQCRGLGEVEVGDDDDDGRFDHEREERRRMVVVTSPRARRERSGPL